MCLCFFGCESDCVYISLQNLNIALTFDRYSVEIILYAYSLNQTLSDDITVDLLDLDPVNPDDPGMGIVFHK